MDIVLPDEAWEDVETGTEALVEEWKVTEGSFVEKGSPLVSVVLVKTTHEVTAPVDGTVTHIFLRAEATFARGASLGTLTPP